ncbi:uncharacterized protein LOC126299045 [Schistocerca gregaria]|uniref:uncharacterized protein LOC126299045 n=1 Tax=Schistocerca gregaria TaxID=7010 RepID=UPI00211F046E|nr:uncharacterized protein LOC126299045 [Schistocerca gregaria]
MVLEFFSPILSFMLISTTHILFLRTILKLQNVLFKVDPNDSALCLATTTKILPAIIYLMVLGTLKRCSTEVGNWTGNFEDSRKAVKPCSSSAWQLLKLKQSK